jgi:hypothetical protein
MSFYTFPTGQTMSGKYLDNWTFGFNRQKYRWKRWTNSTGKSLFIPENSSAERASVGNNLQSVSGVSRTVGWFGSPNGVSTVFYVQSTWNGCYVDVPGPSENPSDPSGCSGGDTDYSGVIAGSAIGTVGTTAGTSNPWNSYELGFGYSLSSGGSESGPDLNATTCGGFYFRYKVRYCGQDSNRGACFSDCT